MSYNPTVIDTGVHVPQTDIISHRLIIVLRIIIIPIFPILV